MNRLILALALALSACGPDVTEATKSAPGTYPTVEVAEVPDAFYPISLVGNRWGETEELAEARKACGGGNPMFVDFRMDGMNGVHTAECR